MSRWLGKHKKQRKRKSEFSKYGSTYQAREMIKGMHILNTQATIYSLFNTQGKSRTARRTVTASVAVMCRRSWQQFDTVGRYAPKMSAHVQAKRLPTRDCSAGRVAMPCTSRPRQVWNRLYMYVFDCIVADDGWRTCTSLTLKGCTCKLNLLSTCETIFVEYILRNNDRAIGIKIDEEGWWWRSVLHIYWFIMKGWHCDEPLPSPLFPGKPCAHLWLRSYFRKLRGLAHNFFSPKYCCIKYPFSGPQIRTIIL